MVKQKPITYRHSVGDVTVPKVIKYKEYIRAGTLNGPALIFLQTVCIQISYLEIFLTELHELITLPEYALIV